MQLEASLEILELRNKVTELHKRNNLKKRMWTHLGKLIVFLSLCFSIYTETLGFFIFSTLFVIALSEKTIFKGVPKSKKSIEKFQEEVEMAQLFQRKFMDYVKTYYNFDFASNSKMPLSMKEISIRENEEKNELMKIPVESLAGITKSGDREIRFIRIINDARKNVLYEGMLTKNGEEEFVAFYINSDKIIMLDTDIEFSERVGCSRMIRDY